MQSPSQMMMDVQCSTDQFDIAYISYMIYIPGKKSYQNLDTANHHPMRLQGICFQIPPVSHRPCSTHILPASLRRRILLAATAFDSPAGREGTKEGYMRARLPKAQKKSTQTCDFSFLVVGLENMYIFHKSYNIYASVHIHCIPLYIYKICIHI